MDERTCDRQAWPAAKEDNKKWNETRSSANITRTGIRQGPSIQSRISSSPFLLFLLLHLRVSRDLTALNYLFISADLHRHCCCCWLQSKRVCLHYFCTRDIQSLHRSAGQVDKSSASASQSKCFAISWRDLINACSACRSFLPLTTADCTASLHTYTASDQQWRAGHIMNIALQNGEFNGEI